MVITLMTSMPTMTRMMLMMVMLIASTPLYAPAHNQRAHPLCKDLLPKWVSCCFSFSYLLHLTTQALRSWSAWRTVIFLLLHGSQVKAASFLFNLWIVVPIDSIRQGQLDFIDFSSSVQAHSMRLNFCGVVLLWQRVQQNNSGGHVIMTSDKASQGVFQYHQNHTRHACDIQSRDKGSCVTRRGQFIE